MADIALQAAWKTPDQARAHFLNVVAPWCKAQWDAGRELHIEVRLRDDVKTDRQRTYLHDFVYAEIARQARPCGVAHSKAAWKAYFHEQYVGTRTVTRADPMTGQLVTRQERISTEDLDVNEYADLIDRVSAFAANELGVEFPMSFTQYECTLIDPDTGESRANA